MNIVPRHGGISPDQLTRRFECSMRLQPLETDHRIPKEYPEMLPTTALRLAVTGNGFSLSLADLRKAWTIAPDEDKPLIEAQARALQEVAA